VFGLVDEGRWDRLSVYILRGPMKEEMVHMLLDLAFWERCDACAGAMMSFGMVSQAPGRVGIH
jgi:hypothetical protein